jgi:hypothetical protein
VALMSGFFAVAVRFLGTPSFEEVIVGLKV